MALVTSYSNLYSNPAQKDEVQFQRMDLSSHFCKKKRESLPKQHIAAQETLYFLTYLSHISLLSNGSHAKRIRS